MPASTGSTSAGKRWRAWPSTMGRSRARAGRWPRPMRRSTSSLAAGRASRRRSRRSPTTSPMTITTSTTAFAPASSTSTRCSTCRWSRRHWAAIERRLGDAPPDKIQRALVRDQIGTMVGDVLAETAAPGRGKRGRDDRRRARRGARAGRLSRTSSRPRSARSSASSTSGSTMRPSLPPVRAEAQRVVAGLAAAYRADRGTAAAPTGEARADAVEQQRADRRLHRRNDRPLRHCPPRGIGRAGQPARPLLDIAEPRRT